MIPVLEPDLLTMLHNDPKGLLALRNFLQQIIVSSKEQYDARALSSILGSVEPNMSSDRLRANAITSYARHHQASEILNSINIQMDASHEHNTSSTATANASAAFISTGNYTGAGTPT